MADSSAARSNDLFEIERIEGAADCVRKRTGAIAAEQRQESGAGFRTTREAAAHRETERERERERGRKGGGIMIQAEGDARGKKWRKTASSYECWAYFRFGKTQAER